MAIADIFSKRQKRLRGEQPDVYTYNQLPEALRIQIVHLWHASIGGPAEFRDDYDGHIQQAYQFVVSTLRREYGVFKLVDDGSRDAHTELVNFFMNETDVAKHLDAVELTFRVIDTHIRSFNYRGIRDADKIADDAIEELNERFKEHGVGYEWTDGEIVRVDSQLIHAEVVKPALTLLRHKRYAGAQEEFLKAHEHYRHGNHKEAMGECLKSLESVLKVICAKRKWTHDPNATVSGLIAVVFEKGLIPAFWQQQFTSLRSTLESGVPTGRNKLAQHGQGGEIVKVPGHIASYLLHLTAVTIVLLVEAEQATNR